MDMSSSRRQRGEEEFKMETKLLCQLRHPNLITLIGFCIDEDEKIIVFEYMSNGSLADHVNNDVHDREPLSWKKRLEICIGVARGLHYLHSGLKRTIIHRHIKPANILLDDNMVPKLAAFGLSIQGQLFTEKPKPIEGKSVAGTFGYMPPESLSNQILTDKFDVYSFGVVLVAVVCGKPIYIIMREMNDFEGIEMCNNGSESSDRITMHFYIMSRLRTEHIDPALVGNIAPECYAVYIDIIDRCLKHEPDERPIMGEVEIQLEHALTLQQEADARDTSDDYLSLFITITQPQQQEASISA